MEFGNFTYNSSRRFMKLIWNKPSINAKFNSSDIEQLTLLGDWPWNAQTDTWTGQGGNPWSGQTGGWSANSGGWSAQNA